MYIFLSSELHTNPRAVYPFTITADQSPQTIVMRCGTAAELRRGITIKKSKGNKTISQRCGTTCGGGNYTIEKPKHRRTIGDAMEICLGN